MGTVRVYFTDNCPYCKMVKAFLDKKHVAYQAINVGQDREAAAEMVKISGQYGVPVLTVDDKVVIGFDTPRLEELFGAEKRADAVDVLIIGAGPAGLTAGVYCARKLLSTVLITENIGGQAMESWAIENYMGYRMISGNDLMQKFEEQVRQQSLRLDLDRVETLVSEGDHFLATTATGGTIQAKAVIVASGMHPRPLGVEGEDRYLGRGLSVCTTCDGPLFKDKKIAIVGGGNAAVQTAIEMSRIASSVSLIVRADLKADPTYIKKLETISNITVHLYHQITQLHGDLFLDQITITDSKTGKETTILLDGVFAEIGWLPNTGFLSDLLTLTGDGKIVVDENCHTNRAGVFAAGDVTSIKGNQIIIAAGEGAKAALEAYRYLTRL
ncbi:FAD-dependent oxidoreductase [Methanosphaerula palustris]|uniref:Glutaredoxin n=1 Tax=Methanosphaerula palustris (strain ATCC BAA-1556 / DSM 19958 / E1-9c) TaxID=521011 RepID=B8GJX6_METPE|nr:FAD-dependent oxidoreductase [Methanosphaerula palustris]ACL15780.1 glutaredoxin [Methanosphaerula palustris E1-9c]